MLAHDPRYVGNAVISRICDALNRPGNDLTIDDILLCLKVHPKVTAVNGRMIRRGAQD